MTTRSQFPMPIASRPLQFGRSSSKKQSDLLWGRARTSALLLTWVCFRSSFVLAQAPKGMPSEEIVNTTISEIREEGLNHSQVMRYAEDLTDRIGSRLTGSPEFDRAADWAVQQLQASGVMKARQESWGEFGMAWTQISTTLVMTSPSSSTLIAQATPWSPATKGEISAELILMPKITTETELDAFKGQLAGKVVLYGLPPAVDLDPKAPLVPVNDTYFKTRMEYPLKGRPIPSTEFDQKAAEAHVLAEKVARFLVSTLR